MKKQRQQEVIDSTKLTEFCRCERRFFYKYVLNWVPDMPNLHLEFGIAWHLAKEHLLRTGDFSEDNVIEAFSLFNEHYRLFFPETEDELREPKTPVRALEALRSYAEECRRNLRYKVLLTEVAGVVPMTSNHDMVFKIDAVVEQDGGLWVVDHKTTSRLSSSWIDAWNLSLQIGTYVHALRYYNPDNNVLGAIIEATVFRKNDHEHVRIPIRKSEASMNQWYWNVSQRLALLEWNFDSLKDCTESDEILTAFPQNYEYCNYYSKCPYFDFCTSWGNPLGHQVPIGFKCEEWNPLESIKDARVRWGEK